jgi:putative DNA primase/helicase
MGAILERFRAALEAHGCHPNGKSARCPGHDDRHASLSFDEGEDGRLLAKCHAGCALVTILTPLGWSEKDCFPPRSGPTTGSPILQTRVYDIRDPTGTLIARHHRTDHLDGSKRIWWERDGRKGLAGLRSAILPLYGIERLARLPSGAAVILVEGEKAADALTGLAGDDLLVLATVTGADGCPSSTSLTPIEGRTVYVWPDHDAPGYKHATHLAEGLQAVGVDPRRIRWTGVREEGDDAADFVARGGTREMLDALLQAAEPYPPPRKRTAADDARPTIIARLELAPVTDEAEAVLLSDLSPSRIYVRARRLVRVTYEAARPPKGIQRPQGSPVIIEADGPWLRERLDRAAKWVKRSADGESRHTLPPPWVAETLLSRGDWPFPPLEGIVECPTLLHDGTIVQTQGYDDASGLLYVPGTAHFQVIPKTPSHADGAAALDALLSPFCDFPWLSLSDLSAFAAALLTTIVRYAIPDPAPLFAFRAPTPGSGKTLLADSISVLATGRPATRWTMPREDDEVRKRLVTLGLAGTGPILLDNIPGILNSTTLSAALTAKTFSDRVLGVQRQVTVDLTGMTWMATGNNMRFAGELGRRVIPIDLDPRCEHPEDRTGWKHPDLLSHLLEHREELVCAALTLLRAYHVAGRPTHGKAPRGSFKMWDDLIRGALLWAGLEDPLDTTARVREEGDEDIAGLRGALGAWRETFGTGPSTTAQAIDRAKTSPSLAAALAEFARTPTDKLDSRRLGYALRGAAGRIVSGLTFRSAGTSHSAVLWMVVSPQDRPANLGEHPPLSDPSQTPTLWESGSPP